MITCSSTQLTRRVIPVVLGLVVVALYVPPVWSVGLRTDLGGHLLEAQQLELSGRSFAPYYLLYQVTIIVRALIPFAALEVVIPAAGGRQATWEISGVVTVAGFVVLAAEVIYFRLLGTLGTIGGRVRGWGWMEAGASVGLMLIAPITVFTWSSRHLVGGYINVTTFDAATTVISKPCALLLFWFVVDRMDAESTAGRDIWVCAALSALAWSAKPSFTICFVPALVVYGAGRALRGRPVAWKFLATGFLLPTVVVGGLLTMGAAHAAGPTGAPGVAFDPLATVGAQLAKSGQPLWVFVPYLLASCAFPLAVAWVHRHQLAGSSSLVLAWLVFGAGVGQYYLFEITGQTDFGDLIGGALIGLFIVYVESTRLALGEERRLAVAATSAEGARRRRGRRWILSGLFVLQVFCGLFLLVHDVTDPAAWW